MNISPADLELLSEEQLCRLARDVSDNDAFALLVQRCTPMIRLQASRFRGGRLDAEDLVQEGILGLLSAVQTYREGGQATFRTYASVCIRRRMISAVRRAGIDPSGTDSLDEAGETEPAAQEETSDPAHMLVRREDTKRLYSRLRQLLTPLEYQVLMYHLGAYSYEETAHALNIGEKTVDNALQRVRRKLSTFTTSI